MVRVGEHDFSVPRKNLINSQIFWLPQDQSSGLKFTINPDDELIHRIIVLVEDDNHCSNIKEDSNKICHDDSNDYLGIHTDRVIERKIRESGAFWTYVSTSKIDREDNVILAECFSIENNSLIGLCESKMNYKDLSVTVHFGDNDFQNLDRIKNDVLNSMEQWELS